jgi:hypothetical protein
VVVAAAGASLFVASAVGADGDGPDLAKYTATPIVSDAFHRVVAGGLGSADLGGAYSTVGPSTQFAVASSGGQIGPIAPGTLDSAGLAIAPVANVQAQAEFSVSNVASAGNGTYLSLQMRNQPDGAHYLARARVAAGGKVVVSLLRYVGNTQTLLGGKEYATGLTVQAGQPFYVEGLVTRSAVPSLSVRAWSAASTPSAWNDVQVDSSPGELATAGGVGFEAYESSSSTGSSVSVLNYSVAALTPVVPVSVTPPPTTSPSTPSAPTSSAPAPTSPSTTTSAPPVTTTPVGPTTPVPSTQTGTGAATLGSTAYPIPSGALFVSPSGSDASGNGSQSAPFASVKKAAAVASPGGTLVLRAGSYNEDVFLTKSLTIQSYPGESVWMDGSIPVSGWTQSGGTWVHTGWNYQFDSSASFSKGSNAGGFVDPNYPMAAHPDQVFVDGRSLNQVSSNPGAGQFSVDYSSGTLVLGSNPAGHAVRASDLQQAFVASAGNVTIQGIGVRNYATSLWQMGVIYLGGSTGNDHLNNLVVQGNATQGISADTSNVTVDHATVTGNGMTGVHANGASGLLIENSYISGNNAEHFNSNPAAAGIKVTNLNGLTIRNNVIQSNNNGNGIWTDVTVSNFVIVSNQVDAAGAPYGIVTELSQSGVVANNIETNAKYGYTAFDTGNVRVFNNAFSNNSVWDVGLSQDSRRNGDSSTAASVPWVVKNIYVANNVFGTSGNSQFYALDKATHTPASSMGITITGNDFPRRAGNAQPAMVAWGGANNSSITVYSSPSALDSGVGASWVNVQTGGTQTAQAQVSEGSNLDSTAVPLPSDIAAEIGQSGGSRNMGPY